MDGDPPKHPDGRLQRQLKIIDFGVAKEGDDQGEDLREVDQNVLGNLLPILRQAHGNSLHKEIKLFLEEIAKDLKERSFLHNEIKFCEDDLEYFTNDKVITEEEKQNKLEQVQKKLGNYETRLQEKGPMTFQMLLDQIHAFKKVHGLDLRRSSPPADSRRSRSGPPPASKKAARHTKSSSLNLSDAERTRLLEEAARLIPRAEGGECCV